MLSVFLVCKPLSNFALDLPLPFFPAPKFHRTLNTHTNPASPTVSTTYTAQVSGTRRQVQVDLSYCCIHKGAVLTVCLVSFFQMRFYQFQGT